MLVISQVLGELIEQYCTAENRNGREYRLVVPASTTTICDELHGYLLSHGVTSYLVISDDRTPNENRGWILPVGLTSKRIGSFVAVVQPGQLSYIHDSIRGSGGAIRALAISEEWPWIDNGPEPFRFDGPVLDKLLNLWAPENKGHQQWLRRFVRDGLLPSCRPSSQRSALFLEQIIGSFDHRLYEQVRDVRKKFLFHAGVPSPSGDLPECVPFVKTVVRLCDQIVDHCRQEENYRELAQGMVTSAITQNRPMVIT